MIQDTEEAVLTEQERREDAEDAELRTGVQAEMLQASARASAKAQSKGSNVPTAKSIKPD